MTVLPNSCCQGIVWRAVPYPSGIWLGYVVERGFCSVLNGVQDQFVLREILPIVQTCPGPLVLAGGASRVVLQQCLSDVVCRAKFFWRGGGFWVWACFHGLRPAVHWKLANRGPLRKTPAPVLGPCLCLCRGVVPNFVPRMCRRLVVVLSPIRRVVVPFPRLSPSLSPSGFLFLPRWSGVGVGCRQAVSAICAVVVRRVLLVAAAGCPPRRIA